MSTEDPNFQEAVRMLSFEKYSNVIGLTLCVYELVATFSAETSLIWNAASRWNIPKVLYICNRYLPIANFIVLTYYTTFDQCVTYAKFSTATVNTTVCIAEMIFTLRTWAAWDRGRIMGLCLGVLFLGIWTTNLTLMGINFKTVDAFKDTPSLCIIGAFQPFAFVPLLLAAFYSITLPLMLIRAYKHLRNSQRTPLVKVFYIDGVFYYICLFSLSWAIVIVEFGNVVDRLQLDVLTTFLPRIQQVFCSIFACRMTLNLRDYGRRGILGVDSEIISPSEAISGFAVRTDPLVFNHADLGLERRNRNGSGPSNRTRDTDSYVF